MPGLHTLASPLARAPSIAQPWVWPLLLIGLATGCGGGSANAKASASASAEGETNFDVEGDAAWDTVAEPAEAGTAETAEINAAIPEPAGEQPPPAGLAISESAAGRGPPALLGARHDVYLEDGGPAACSCLAVVVGQPSDSRLKWSSKPPKISPAQQLVVALSSVGVPCSQEAAEASYMGYQIEGANVVVSVEAATEGRPVTRGAVVPKPGSGGKILVKAAGKVPYGNSLEDPKAPCQVYP